MKRKEKEEERKGNERGTGEREWKQRKREK